MVFSPSKFFPLSISQTHFSSLSPIQNLVHKLVHVVILKINVYTHSYGGLVGFFIPFKYCLIKQKDWFFLFLYLKLKLICFNNRFLGLFGWFGRMGEGRVSGCRRTLPRIPNPTNHYTHFQFHNTIFPSRRINCEEKGDGVLE